MSKIAEMNLAEQIKTVKKLARNHGWEICNSLNKDRYNFHIYAHGFKLEHVQYNEGYKLTEYWRFIYKDFVGEQKDFKGTWETVIKEFIKVYNEYIKTALGNIILL
jgi:hypothetical protein